MNAFYTYISEKSKLIIIEKIVHLNHFQHSFTSATDNIDPDVCGFCIKRTGWWMRHKMVLKGY